MRLRIRFAKDGALRYIGHLDLHKIWERTVRRAGLPLAYTQGFHPGPKIQLASALPLGFIGRAELVDIWLELESTPEANPSDPEPGACMRAYQNRLQAAAPPGLNILEIEEVDPHSPPLQNLIVSAQYAVSLLEPVNDGELAEKIQTLLGMPALPRERRGKSYDLRPLVEDLALVERSPSPAAPGMVSAVQIGMRLSAREGATGRPEEVLDSLGIPLEMVRIERTQLIFQNPPEKRSRENISQ